MSTLSKKTKAQLVEIAEDLEIDISDCKVKKEVYDIVREYFINNSTSFDENSKYYELAMLSKFGSPKKTVYIESEDGDVKEVDVVEAGADDDETDVAIDEEEETDGSESVKDEEDKDDDVEDEDEDDDDEEDDDDDDFECYVNFFKAVQHGTVPEYLELKNYEIRDYLGDPYTLNELTFYIETLVLMSSLTEFTPIDTYLPQCLLSYLPAYVCQFPVVSLESFNYATISTVALWYFTAKSLPLIISYYINFTYDFDRDAFTEALAKLFLAILVFKTDLGISSVTNEVKYAFSLGDIKLETFKHFVFIATLNLRAVFGNWILLDAVFTSILAFYANLAFV